jgi:hypothetical protein
MLHYGQFNFFHWLLSTMLFKMNVSTRAVNTATFVPIIPKLLKGWLTVQSQWLISASSTVFPRTLVFRTA